MSKPILTKIEDAMKDGIEGLTKGSGYYFDWGTVNEPDVAKQRLPSAEIYVDTEDNDDSESGAWSRGYSNSATFVIKVRAGLQNEESTPAYEINKELNKCLDDLKRYFGINYTVSDSCETIMYRGMKRVVDQIGDVLRPKYMTTEWLVRYTQDREQVDRLAV